MAGIFKVGNTAYDSNFAFMALDQAQAFFDYDGAVSQIEVMVTNPLNDYAMTPALAKAAGPHTRLVPWQNINGSFLDAIDVESSVMFLILSLIILVAALNIISGLVMLVTDKSADIAILRTMGASRGAIMRVFLIAGMSIGVTGTLLGVGLGVVFCLNIESNPPGPAASDRHRPVRSHHLFPFAHSRRSRPGAGRGSGGAGAGADVPGHALSQLAGGAARSGRGAAL